MMKIYAGQLSMQYQNGFLRHIQCQDTKIIDMIYYALRDANWKTIHLQIKNEEITQCSNTFLIRYQAISKTSDMEMAWQAEIEGRADNSIQFHIWGKALKKFKKNRSGFCILHPVKENIGKSMIIFHPGNIQETVRFPDYISPNVIATDIQEIHWKITDNMEAKLRLSGDLFEMEDHRNWTDNSFKTYCTPLTKSYPVLMQINESVDQKVDLTVAGIMPKKKPVNKNMHIKVEISNQKLPISPIGIGRSGFHPFHLDHLSLLRNIGFNHYRVDVIPGNKNWKTDFEDAMAEARLLETPLEIILLFSMNYREEVKDFISVSVYPSQVSHFSILTHKNKYTDNEMLGHVVPLIRKYYPQSPVGSGTDAFFAELNRSSLEDSLIDFVTYSVNPQVHATDDETIIENLYAQQETVISARNKFPGKHIHISPATLRSRNNPDVTDVETMEQNEEDPRHKTYFGAGWLLGSLKYVLEGEIDSITYFETSGNLGLLDTDIHGKTIMYPMVKIFKTVLDKKWKNLLVSTCSQPTIISSLVLGAGGKRCFLIANHTKYHQTVEITDSHNDIRFSKILTPFQILYKTV